MSELDIAENKLKAIRTEINTLCLQTMIDSVRSLEQTKKWYLSVEGNTLDGFNEIVTNAIKTQDANVCIEYT